MSRIKGKNTKPEQEVARALGELGVSWCSHADDLPGRPDFVFREARIIVFVDGDFWHGWRFPLWRDKLTVAWEQKIAANRARDQRNQKKLRRMGWKVLRIWEHQLKNKPEKAIERIAAALIASGSLGLEP